jgi:hypothetical protein
MRNVSTVVSLLSLLAGAGCALPIEAGEHEAVIDDVDESRVFTSDDGYYEAAPLDFSFVIDAGGPQVVLATVGPSANWSTGPTVWAEPAWLSDELFVRRDVDAHRVPVELLMRLGEPFLGWNGRGERCEGYLGEPSIVRAVATYNLSDLASEGMIEEEVREVIWNGDYTGAPTESLADPEVIWKIAGRTYFVAAWESDDDCRPAHWGAHPEHQPVVFEEVDSGAAIEDAALRAFRAHPGYEYNQQGHDEARRFDRENGYLGTFPAGPWDADSFAARTFRAPDGRTLVVAVAGEECGGFGLSAVYDVAADGTLTLRPDWGTRESDVVILETEEGALHYLTKTDLSALSEHPDARDLSVAPIQTGCGC